MSKLKVAGALLGFSLAGFGIGIVSAEGGRVLALPFLIIGCLILIACLCETEKNPKKKIARSGFVW